jgi:hypothetical protein
LIHPSTTAIINGSYGIRHRLEEYDKVLICANGIGISTQLPYIRHILECHNLRTAQVRRLSIVWQLEKGCMLTPHTISHHITKRYYYRLLGLGQRVYR